jgi:NAD(P)-dependent dehydrogenase (short-subunit alcohol dehydrogenase family)
MDDLDFDGSVVVVTGAASGIGRASARAFAARGATVVAADLDLAGCVSTLADLPKERCLAVEVDVGEERQVASMVEQAEQRFGRVDVLHNNAGIAGEPAPLHLLTEQQWDNVLGVNLRGGWLCMKHVLIGMRERRAGAIVNTSSVAGSAGFAKLGAYCASKAGLTALTQVAACEVADLGIRVNAVCPGMIATPLADATRGDPKAGPFPSRRLGDVEEVVAAVTWLSSDAASYVNGICLPVDGGWSATLGPRRGTQSSDTNDTGGTSR